MKEILDQIRAEIAAAEARLEDLRDIEGTLERLLGMAPPVPEGATIAKLGKLYVDIVPPPPPTGGPITLGPTLEVKQAPGSITAAIQAQLGESGPMTKGNLEKALSASRSLKKQTVSAALQAMKRRGVVKLHRGKWKLG